MKRVPAAALAILAAAIVATGCGGEDSSGAAFERGDAPAPAECIRKWNSDSDAATVGKHAYLSHQSRAAQVFLTAEDETGLDRRCAVVFAVAESDREYGTVGEVDFPGREGWEYITYLPSEDPRARFEMQRRAAEQANAQLTSDGKIAPFE